MAQSRPNPYRWPFGCHHHRCQQPERPQIHLLRHIPESELPNNLSSYDKRIQAANALKARMDALAQDQQEDMIDLQTLVNRRDSAYSTASNVVRALATSSMDDAKNF